MQLFQSPPRLENDDKIGHGACTVCTLITRYAQDSPAIQTMTSGSLVDLKWALCLQQALADIPRIDVVPVTYN